MMMFMQAIAQSISSCVYVILTHRIDDDDVYERSDLILTGSRASETRYQSRDKSFVPGARDKT